MNGQTVGRPVNILLVEGNRRDACLIQEGGKEWRRIFIINCSDGFNGKYLRCDPNSFPTPIASQESRSMDGV